MKRIAIFFLIFTMTLSVIGCGSGEITTGSTASNIESTGTTEPSSSVTEPTEPTRPADPTPVKPEVPPEPTDPANLVTEARTDALGYVPAICSVSGNYYLQFDFILPQDCYPEMEITYDLSCVYSRFYWSGKVYDLNAPLPNDTFLTATWFDSEEIDAVIESGGSAFLEVIIRADGYIVGCGVFEIATDGEYQATMRSEAVIFPVIDGMLQYVTEEYIADILAQMKQTTTALDVSAKFAEMDAYWIAVTEKYWDDYYTQRAPVESDTVHVTSSYDLFESDPEMTANTVVHIMNDPEPVISNAHKLAAVYGDPKYTQYIYGSDQCTALQIEPYINLGIGIRGGQISYLAETNYSGLYVMSSGLLEFAGSECTVSGVVCWKGPGEWPAEYASMEKPDRIWVDILIMSRDHIVGFAVFEVVSFADVHEGYQLIFHYSEVYDYVDGRFQNVSEEFVRSRMEACHRKFAEE